MVSSVWGTGARAGRDWAMRVQLLARVCKSGAGAKAIDMVARAGLLGDGART